MCKHYDRNGFGTRRHGNVGKSSHNAFTISDEQNVIKFISNYADYNAMPLPGRMPKMKDYTVIMLPSDVTSLTYGGGILKNVPRHLVELWD